MWKIEIGDIVRHCRTYTGKYRYCKICKIERNLIWGYWKDNLSIIGDKTGIQTNLHISKAELLQSNPNNGIIIIKKIKGK